MRQIDFFYPQKETKNKLCLENQVVISFKTSKF